MRQPGAWRDRAYHALSRRRRTFAAAIGLAAVLLSVLVMSADSEAANDPPVNGNWVVGVGEDVRHDNVTLDLRGDLDVRGTLVLDNCTLFVWLQPVTPRVLTVHDGGRLVAINSFVSRAGSGVQFSLRGMEGCDLGLLDTSVLGAGSSLTSPGLDTGFYLEEDARLERVAFADCLVGLMVQGAVVGCSGCTFVDCDIGAAVTEGELRAGGGGLSGCEIGLLCDGAKLLADGVTFEDCREALLDYGGEVEADDCTFRRSTLVGVGVYDGTATVRGCTFEDADSGGVTTYGADVHVLGSTFRNLTSDISAAYARLTVSRTHHFDTYDEAIYLYRSEIDADNVTTSGSYWMLRGARSSGHCQDMTAINVSLGLDLDECQDLVVERARIDGGRSKARPNPRGVLVQGAYFTLRDSFIENVRNGIVVTGGGGLVERVEIANASKEGVFVSLCWDLVLRDVNVTNAIDGFRLNLFSGNTLERCGAFGCSATGYNYTARARSRLVDCNSSLNPVGVLTTYSYPRLVNMTFWMCDERGEQDNVSRAMESYFSSPSVEGGLVWGGKEGIYVNDSRSRISCVEFRGQKHWSVEYEESQGDVLEGCTFVGAENSTAIVVHKSETELLGNTVMDMDYAVKGYNNATIVAEGNRFDNITWDGVWLLMNSTGAFRANEFSGCYFAINVMLYSAATSLDDSFHDCAKTCVFMFQRSGFSAQGSTFSNTSIGVWSEQAYGASFSNCEFSGINRGILVYGEAKGRPLPWRVATEVVDCYFTNMSAYCVGAFGGELLVSGSSFVDNIGCIQVRNATVDIRECSMVGSWIFGLDNDNSQVTWTVRDFCRIVASDILGHVDLQVLGGTLEVLDTVLELELWSRLLATGGAQVTLMEVTWEAAGSPFTVEDSHLVLDGCTFLKVGQTPNAGTNAKGVHAVRSVVEATGTSFRDSTGGLSLHDSTAMLDGCSAIQCTQYGIFLQGTTATLNDTDVATVFPGTGVRAVLSPLAMFRCQVSHAVISLAVIGAEAYLDNCTLEGARDLSVFSENATVVLMNTTHEGAKVETRGEGSVEVWWHLSIRLDWPIPGDFPSSLVWVEDSVTGTVFEGPPDATGSIRYLAVLSVNWTTVRDDLGPHTVRARLFGYTAARTLTIDGPTEVVLNLRDEVAPVIELDSPSSKLTWSRTGLVLVAGRAEDVGTGTETVTVRLDYGSSLWTASGDSFAFTISMTDGRHVIEVNATDRMGNWAMTTLTVDVETRPLVMSPPDPPDGTITRESTAVIRGRLSRVDHVNVTVNTGRTELDVENKTFELEVTLREGENDYSILAQDIYGHRTWSNLSVLADWTAPDLALTTPLVVNTTEEWVEIRGTAGEDATVTIQDELVLMREGAFSVRFPVYVGESLLTVEAVDEAGNARELGILVNREVPEEEDRGPNAWEVLPFVLAIPLLAAAELVVMRRGLLGGDEG